MTSCGSVWVIKRIVLAAVPTNIRPEYLSNGNPDCDPPLKFACSQISGKTNSVVYLVIYLTDLERAHALQMGATNRSAIPTSGAGSPVPKMRDGYKIYPDSGPGL
jgi:hypothetical protein